MLVLWFDLTQTHTKTHSTGGRDSNYANCILLELTKYVNALTVCSYHVTYMFQCESTLYSCLNVKDPLTFKWHLSDSNWTHNHLVCKWTLHHLAKLTSLAKWLIVSLQTNWLWVRVQLQSLKCEIFLLFPNIYHQSCLRMIPICFTLTRIWKFLLKNANDDLGKISQ